MQKKIVSVYGYGRFGKLWADILAADHHVKVFSRRGLKPEEVPAGIEIANEENIFDCDAMFFCVAISALEEVLKSTRAFHRSHTVFFDTCSVKVFPARWMEAHLPPESQIIATHPMFGPDSYNTSRLMPMVMCNIRTRGVTFEEWVNYFSNKSMQVEIMTPDEHDKTVAYSQGITHYIGRVLKEINLVPTNINTLGYQKLLEIIEQTCNDSWQLFIDLQKYNPYTGQMREDLNRALNKIYSVFSNEKSNNKNSTH